MASLLHLLILGLTGWNRLYVCDGYLELRREERRREWWRVKGEQDGVAIALADSKSVLDKLRIHMPKKIGLWLISGSGNMRIRE